MKRVDLADGLTGVDRIELLLRANGFRGVAAWARSVDERREAVWQAITGARRNAVSDRILGKLAISVGKHRRVIDALVAGEPEPVDAVAVNDGAQDSREDR